MNPINYGRVALGTILGGMIIAVLDAVVNGWLLMPWWSRVVAEGVGKPETRGAIALMMGKDVLIAFLLAVMYAAVRPRFGPGPRTAVLVGIAGWLLAYLPEFLDTAAWIRIPRSLAGISFLLGLVQCVGATLAAGKVYMESMPSSPTAR